MNSIQFSLPVTSLNFLVDVKSVDSTREKSKILFFLVAPSSPLKKKGGGPKLAHFSWLGGKAVKNCEPGMVSERLNYVADGSGGPLQTFCSAVSLPSNHSSFLGRNGGSLLTLVSAAKPLSAG